MRGIAQMLTRLPLDGRRELSGVGPRRAEIIAAGAVVYAEILDECQRAIGYHFRQPDLLRASLTHTSGASTRVASNERLERQA